MVIPKSVHPVELHEARSRNPSADDISDKSELLLGEKCRPRDCESNRNLACTNANASFRCELPVAAFYARKLERNGMQAILSGEPIGEDINSTDQRRMRAPCTAANRTAAIPESIDAPASTRSKVSAEHTATTESVRNQR